jgi:hypothetical protein
LSYKFVRFRAERGREGSDSLGALNVRRFDLFAHSVFREVGQHYNIHEIPAFSVSSIARVISGMLLKLPEAC